MSKVLRLQVRDSLTRAASPKTMDSILNNVSTAEMAAYFAGRAKMNPGMVWDGIFKPLLQAMDKKTRDEVMGEITNYGNELATSKSIGETAASGLIFGGENEDDEEVEGQAIVEGTNPDGTVGQGKPWTIDAVNQANRKFWKDGKQVSSGKPSSLIDAMNKANESFWKK